MATTTFDFRKSTDPNATIGRLVLHYDADRTVTIRGGTGYLKPGGIQ